MARPKKYVSQKALRTVRELAARGASQVEIAAAVGMSSKTWRRARNEDEAVAEVLAEGREIEHDQLVGMLFRLAMGAPAEFDADGNLLRAETAPNAAAGMFLLKCRHNFRDFGPISVAPVAPDGPWVTGFVIQYVD